MRAEVDDRLRTAGFTPTSRPKTRKTLTEKPIRDGFPLTKVQDFVGARIVLPATEGRQRQYEVVRRIEEVLFPDMTPKRRDRIKEPSHGYRAIHVILRARGVPLEVQVRTHYQHQWAEFFEALADVLGRGIRYGGPIDAGRIPVHQREHARSVLKWAQSVSGYINAVEEAQMEVDTSVGALGVLDEDELRDALAGAQNDLDEVMDRLRVSARSFEASG